jgi:hypothetical protein
VRTSGFVYNGESGLSIWAGWPWPDNPNFYFDGKVDEVYLYRKALSSTDIKILYETLK